MAADEQPTARISLGRLGAVKAAWGRVQLANAKAAAARAHFELTATEEIVAVGFDPARVLLCLTCGDIRPRNSPECQCERAADG